LASAWVRSAADRLRDPGIVTVFVHPVAGAGEADVRDLPEPDILTGLGLQALVEPDRVFVQLADRVGHVEQRQQAGGVPGRSGGQLLALDQDDVRPAFLHEMIQRAHADHPAPDHHHARDFFHGPLSSHDFSHRQHRSSQIKDDITLIIICLLLLL
jgi:hypothetical protein